MPFLGKDWRSDGDIWVRTDHGWETLRNWRVKIHENINYNVLQRLLRQSIQQPEKSEELIECSKRALYLHVPKISPCRISTGQSNVMFTEAVSTLDFAGAFKDSRRANYVYKMMEILVQQRLLNMSGAVQNQLFTLLEHALQSAVETKEHKQQLVELLERLLSALKDNQYGYQHMGSNFQWGKHYDDVIVLLDRARNIRLPVRADDDGLTFTELPYDVIRNILLYLCAQEDLVNTGKASPEIHSVVADNSLWRDLCLCHFTRQQLQHYQQHRHKHRDINWYKVYTKLYRRYGTIERYADMICRCSSCNIIFWKSTGHPCKHEECVPEDITPAGFVKMFNV